MNEDENQRLDISIDNVLAACAWAEYRNEYGVGTLVMKSAHKAFLAGWAAARGETKEGVQR